MTDEGIIEQEVVPVKKKGGSTRLCVDYRRLNVIASTASHRLYSVSFGTGLEKWILVGEHCRPREDSVHTSTWAMEIYSYALRSL